MEHAPHLPVPWSVSRWQGLTIVLLDVILAGMTKRAAISLPDELFRQIEQARKRAGMDRSAWLQEAATDYLKRRTKQQEIEAYFKGYERAPLTDDELSLLSWNEEHFDEASEQPTAEPRRGRR